MRAPGVRPVRPVTFLGLGGFGGGVGGGGGGGLGGDDDDIGTQTPRTFSPEPFYSVFTVLS